MRKVEHSTGGFGAESSLGVAAGVVRGGEDERGRGARLDEGASNGAEEGDVGGPLLRAGGILPVDVHAVESAIEAETRKGSGEAAAEALVRGDEGKGVGATGAAEGDEELGP